MNLDNSSELLTYHEAISNLVESEEQLVEEHKSIIETDQFLLEEERALLEYTMSTMLTMTLKVSLYVQE